MTYQERVKQVPASIKQDPLWRFDVYPKALLLANFAWEDCATLMKDRRGLASSISLFASPALLAPIWKKVLAVATGGLMLAFSASRWVPRVNRVAGTTVAESSPCQSC